MTSTCLTKTYVGNSYEADINTLKPHTLFLSSWWIESSRKLDATKHFLPGEAFIWFGLALFQGYFLQGENVFRNPIYVENMIPTPLVWHTLPP